MRNVYVMKLAGNNSDTRRWYFTSLAKGKAFAQAYLRGQKYTEHVRIEGCRYHAFVTANRGDDWKMYFIYRENLNDTYVAID